MRMKDSILVVWLTRRETQTERPGGGGDVKGDTKVLKMPRRAGGRRSDVEGDIAAPRRRSGTF